ncbi:MAG: glycosyltransferase [Actinomycetota bacterium]
MNVLTDALTRQAIRKAVGILGARVMATVLIGYRDLFKACPEGRKVLYLTDDFLAGAKLMGVPESRLSRAEIARARQADLVIGVSSEICERWSSFGHSAKLVPNGCDDVLFNTTDQAPYPDDVTLTPPIAGFVGHLSERIDLPMLLAVARRGHSVLLVGPLQGTFDAGKLEPLLELANVQWVGPKPFEALPSYLRSMHVGLTPYANSAFNNASFPLKTLEYLAAGRAVVATALPAITGLNTELVRLATTSEQFADQVEAAFSEPVTKELSQTRRSFAARHSWRSRTKDFADALGLLRSPA